MDFANIPDEVLDIEIEQVFSTVAQDWKAQTLRQALEKTKEDIITADFSAGGDPIRITELTAWTKSWVIWYDGDIKGFACLRYFARNPKIQGPDPRQKPGRRKKARK